ncbi:hypothetical protein [uncultured Methanoregula sp.]|uniref:hypothetical protein n=1 Tax=uncultured Methanoregula sp. TaxID=1005933 RepID=UPI002AAADDD4|nr:hypothetical protein [uncultured Methanoregula sp.]
MSREKIKVPGKVYEELVALQREIHFTQDHQDTIKKAEDRGYMNAANWIRQNEQAYKIGFAWGFESTGEEPQGTLREIPTREMPAQKRTITRPEKQVLEARPSNEARPIKRSSSGSKSGSKSSGGFFAGIKNWLGKYF